MYDDNSTNKVYTSVNELTTYAVYLTLLFKRMKEILIFFIKKQFISTYSN